MKSKYPFFVWIFIVSAFFLKAQVSSQNISEIKLNPWFSGLDISFVSGGAYAALGEYEYKKDSSADYALLSRLDWKPVFMWTVGTKLRCSMQRWHILFDASTALPVFHTATMEDRDWETLDTEPTRLSKHRVHLDSFFDAKAAIAYCFWKKQSFSLETGGAFEYTATELTAYNGITFKPLPQKNYSGNVASYAQRLYIPWLMLSAQWKACRLFETDVHLFFSPLTFIRALDSHYQVDSENASLAPKTDRQYSDRIHGPASFKTELTLRFNAGKKNTKDQTVYAHRQTIQHAFELHTGCTFVPELRGAHYWRYSTAMPFARTQNKSASSYLSFCISLAYCMRIR